MSKEEEFKERFRTLEKEFARIDERVSELIEKYIPELTKGIIATFSILLIGLTRIIRYEVDLKDHINEFSRNLPSLDKQRSLLSVEYVTLIIANIYSEFKEMEKRLGERIGLKESKELIEQLEEELSFRTSIKTDIRYLLSLCKISNISFDEFLSVALDKMGKDLTRKLISKEMVLKAYGIEDANRYEEYMSK